MSYVLIRVYSFECDRCETVGDDYIPGAKGFPGNGLDSVRAQARQDGWTFGEQDLCPRCNARFHLDPRDESER